jgi:hypothetical protein
MVEPLSEAENTRMGCTSCLVAIVGGVLLFAAVFGVTVDGKTYLIRCSTERGVEVRR